MNVRLVILFLLLSNISFGQEFKTTSKDDNANVIELNFYNVLDGSVSTKYSTTGLGYKPNVILEDNNSVNEFAKTFNSKTVSNSGSPYLEESAPSDMTDKYTLKPSPGNLSSGSPTFNEDLHNGKVNVSIPFFEFNYFDYKIPISINNRYPQVIESTFGEPVFYTNSDVGGDWTLSIDEFKVSRQVNGIEDENASKGYFSTLSQSKFSYPINLSNDDIHNGLKGDWDPAIDIFHYSTPYGSGSFLVDLNIGSYQILAGSKVHIDFELINNELWEFTITDNSGVKYVYGGDASAIEISQSKTDVLSLGRYKDGNYKRNTVTHIIEVINNKVETISPFSHNANFFANDNLSPIVLRPTVADMLLSIDNNSNNFSAIDTGVFPALGGNSNGSKYYAVVDYYADNGLTILLNGETYDDPDLRRQKANTGWYLKEIILENKKKILFSYTNNDWQAYKTFASNKIKIDAQTTGEEVTYQYIGKNNITGNLYGAELYGCFPEELTFMQFPINETHTATTHFVKKPKLISIADEDDFSELIINRSTWNPKGYVGNPASYSNAPTETIGAQNNGLISSITLSRFNEEKVDTVIFNNHTVFSYYTHEGVTYSEPWKDRSFLNHVTVNGTKKYSFEYVGSRLKRIKYPTGGVKEFFSSNVTRSNTKCYYNFNLITGQGGFFYGLHEAVVDKIITTANNNSKTEKYVYNTPASSIGVYTIRKTYRPDIVSCTSFATMYSTSPIYNNHISNNGTAYLKVQKYINDELQYDSEFSGTEQGNPFPLTLTDGTTPSYLNTIGKPVMYLDEKKGLLNKNVIYKTNKNGVPEPITETTFTRIFKNPEYAYPSLYLTKIEAGPWQNTNGAIKRAWSLYLPASEYYMTEEHKTIKNYDGSGNYLTNKESTFFKRTRYPNIGLNSLRPYKTKFYNNDDDFFETFYFSPIEIEGLPEFNTAVNIRNPLFNNLLSNNKVPNLETILYRNGKLLDATSKKFKFTPNNPSGDNFVVIENEKRLELQNANSTSNEYSIQSIDPNNLESIIFDNKLKDKVFYDKYDEDGRLLEFHSLDGGVYTTIIWGYKKQFPVAIIKNARYSDVENLAQSIQTNSNSPQNFGYLTINLNNLRSSLPEALVTTYTYKGAKPSIITDPRGDSIQYHYDDDNRLIMVTDDNGDILSKNEYHYYGSQP